jgi:hypothetical protein
VFQIAIAVAGGTVACSSSGLNVGSNKGGPSASDAAAVQKETTAACEVLKTYADRCSVEIDDCTLKTSERCPETFSRFRSEYTAALASCGYSKDCSGRGDAIDIRICREKAVEGLQPTLAQKDLARAVCDVCGPCDEATLWTPGKTFPDGAVSVGGTGTAFYLYNDATIATLRSTCVPASKGSACFQEFYTCIQTASLAAAPESVRSACGPQVGPVPGK